MSGGSGVGDVGHLLGLRRENIHIAAIDTEHQAVVAVEPYTYTNSQMPSGW